MMKRLTTGMILSAALMTAQIGNSLAADRAHGLAGTKIEQQVRKELVTLPFYNLFDSFTFRVDGETATRPGPRAVSPRRGRQPGRGAGRRRAVIPARRTPRTGARRRTALNLRSPELPRDREDFWYREDFWLV